MQGNETAKQLEKDDKEGKVPKELYNNYTVISYSNGEYSQVAYATYFKEEIAEIVSLFDAWIAGVHLALSAPSACMTINRMVVWAMQNLGCLQVPAPAMYE